MGDVSRPESHWGRPDQLKTCGCRGGFIIGGRVFAIQIQMGKKNTDQMDVQVSKGQGFTVGKSYLRSSYQSETKPQRICAPISLISSPESTTNLLDLSRTPRSQLRALLDDDPNE